ncbi:DUF4365 domain-containing protein [Actinosynnema pretiosum]|uniref:DUF4365 domain-containing protein n=1 Tax=Actinosynnema pretiosum TaxID=42197 RepID=A0A290Z3W2_9PSEU|nr:DUF4365 domain-containing protein [Actinosynnema pretiosum]ATE53643.1 DUF4365 domain-containing protein [Actinosynnema pretiosum]
MSVDGDEADADAVLLGGGLPRSAAQEQFSLAYVQLVAAAGGYSIKRHETDYDGVDLTLYGSGPYSGYKPEFEMQLKCTRQQSLLKADHLAWSMKRKPFEKLTLGKRYIPALLGVIIIPEGIDDLLSISEDGLVTTCRMYWQWRQELGTIQEGSKTKTVRLPRSNLFDVHGLQKIMETIEEGGEW